MEKADEDAVIDGVCIAKVGESAKRTGKQVFAMRHQRRGWSAEMPLYVLWCGECREFTVTHPAGYGRITCLACRRNTRRVMTWQRFRDKRLKPLLHVFPRLTLAALLVLIVYLLARR